MLHFKAACPKCNEKVVFNVLHCSSGNASEYAEIFLHDDWREYDFSLFSISSVCNNCKHVVSANISPVYDYEKNKNAVLTDYASEHDELVSGPELLIQFDCPPLIPNKKAGEGSIVDIDDLLAQAEACFKINAWDAVGVLCRKILDVKTLEEWGGRNEKIPTLNDRIIKIFNVKENNPHKDKFDFNLENHQLAYDAHLVRLLGNDAAHDQIVFDGGDAECILVFTKSFLDKYCSSRA
ncbi:hypothetical protein [Chromobacterium sp. IIBBL 290-4]|uniref:hypothetical protein n=1 Tax=Chromobacterium sp. IIBBL 290-4 TaxID=2953890 RepID=UPI0020B76681|nr:hypothetical protein [Chromobacterium sp. IIBBL 290-4]UTH73327.1 hypothetical protein NKT35_17570 [Chromobacterium sp. IIBBL 290-4]